MRAKKRKNQWPPWELNLLTHFTKLFCELIGIFQDGIGKLQVQFVFFQVVSEERRQRVLSGDPHIGKLQDGSWNFPRKTSSDSQKLL